MSTTGPSTRKIEQSIEISADPSRVFRALVTPTDICRWWGAARAIVLDQANGIWMAAWGEDADDPDFITAAIIAAIDPPHQLLLTDYRYRAKSGPLPFDADFETEFNVIDQPTGCSLSVSQRGFPDSSAADEFFAGCQDGWHQSLQAIADYLTTQ